MTDDNTPAIPDMTDAECAIAYRDLRRRANDAGFATVGEWIDEQPETEELPLCSDLTPGQRKFMGDDMAFGFDSLIARTKLRGALASIIADPDCCDASKAIARDALTYHADSANTEDMSCEQPDTDPLGEGEEYGVTGEWWGTQPDTDRLAGDAFDVDKAAHNHAIQFLSSSDGDFPELHDLFVSAIAEGMVEQERIDRTDRKTVLEEAAKAVMDADVMASDLTKRKIASSIRALAQGAGK